jgi:hypothetical protein
LVWLLATVPFVATITVAESSSAATTPVHTTSPVITDLFRWRISITPLVDCSYCSRNGPVAPALTFSIDASASS